MRSDGDYAVLRGTIPGPASRFAVVRYPMRRKAATVVAPQVIEVSTRAGA